MESMFGKREGGGRRIVKRVDASLPALLITMSDRHPAVLSNISRTGALLHAKDAPPNGTAPSFFSRSAASTSTRKSSGNRARNAE